MEYSVIHQDTRFSEHLSKLDDDPALNEYANNILKTIEQMKAKGLSVNIRNKTFSTLQRLNKHVDLMNSEAVKLYIADLKVKKTAKDIEKSTKQKYINQYDYFVQFNNLSWEKPIYRFDTKVPITPTKIQATQIISAAPTQHGATIFNILLEAGFEGQELRNTTRKDIDTEQGIITVAGTKGHRGRAYKFSHNTTEMLRTYLNKTTENEPFPRPQIMADSWRTARTAAAHKTGNTELLKIPLKGLRNLSGIIVYERTLDPWRVMLHMGHKKLDTTQHYLSAMIPQNNEEAEYTCKTAKTPEEAIQLIEAGFQYVNNIGDLALYRKRK